MCVTNWLRPIVLITLGLLWAREDLESYNFRRKHIERNQPVAGAQNTLAGHGQEQRSAHSQGSNPYDLGRGNQRRVKSNDMTSDLAMNTQPAKSYTRVSGDHSNAIQATDHQQEGWNARPRRPQPSKTPFAVSEREVSRNMVRNTLERLRDKPLENGSGFASFMTESNLNTSTPVSRPKNVSSHYRRERNQGRILKNPENSNSSLQLRPYRGRFYSKGSKPFVLDPGLAQRWKSRAPKPKPEH